MVLKKLQLLSGMKTAIHQWLEAMILQTVQLRPEGPFHRLALMLCPGRCLYLSLIGRVVEGMGSVAKSVLPPDLHPLRQAGFD